MESNNLILGRIPGSGSGIRKTYEESFFVENADNRFCCDLDRRESFYINKNNGQVIEGSNKIRNDSDYKELAILGILPYVCGSNNSLYFIYEVIEKDILHRHLVEEKMLLEEQIKSGIISEEKTKKL